MVLGYIFCTQCNKKVYEKKESKNFLNLIFELENTLLCSHACHPHHMINHIEYKKSNEILTQHLKIICLHCLTRIEFLNEQIQKNQEYLKDEKIIEKQQNLELYRTNLSRNIENSRIKIEELKQVSIMNTEVPIWFVNSAVLSFHTAHEGHKMKIYYGTKEFIESEGKEGQGYFVESPQFNK